MDVCWGLKEKPAHQQPFLDDINQLPLPFFSAQPVNFTTTWLPSHSFYETARGLSCLCIPPPRGREREGERVCMLYMYVQILCHNLPMCFSLTNKHPQYNLLPSAVCFIAFLITLCLVYKACEDRHMHNMWCSPSNEEMLHRFKRNHTLQTKNVRERKSLETLHIHQCHYLQQPVYQMPMFLAYIYTAVGQELD